MFNSQWYTLNIYLTKNKLKIFGFLTEIMFNSEYFLYCFCFQNSQVTFIEQPQREKHEYLIHSLSETNDLRTVVNRIWHFYVTVLITRYSEHSVYSSYSTYSLTEIQMFLDSFKYFCFFLLFMFR